MDEKVVKDSQGLAKDLVNDCISRQAAIERATKDHDFYKGATTPADMARRDELLNVMCWLGELPSAPLKSYRKGYQAGFNEGYQAGFKDAQSEQKRGKWIDYTDEGYVECPFCHSATNCDGNKDELHFCFSCGADMRGEQNDKGRR